MSNTLGVITPKARIPRRFYRGKPRKLVVPEKLIRPCEQCGTHRIFRDPKAPALCPGQCSKTEVSA